MIKNDEKPIQKYRFFSQLFFLLICIWIGVEFYYFIQFLQSDTLSSNFYRPAGVEAFLPISALMSIYYFILTGTIHSSHPAGFFILLGVLSVSLVFGKSFCSWICPIGFISELIGDFGEKIITKTFKRKFFIPKIVDYPLRAIKYLLFGFFIYVIFFSMTVLSLKMFLDSPYNLVADIKMYVFFANITKFSFIVVFTLFTLSIFIRGFWCRYLCPYGALLGAFSFFSLTRIRRNKISCINCNLCTKVCSSRIKVNKVKTVYSDECTMCLNCVDVCPVKDTLVVEDRFTKYPIKKLHIAIGVLIVYFFVIITGRITGNWNSNISAAEYKQYYKTINMLGHPTNTTEINELNKKAKNNK
ncbi:MAG: 4Fe-4S binding protein [bacterium]